MFCGETLSGEEPTTKLQEKGCEGIAKANVLRNCNITTVPGQVVHVKRRKNFCSPTGISSAVKRLRPSTDSDDSGPCARRSTSAPFDYKTHCLFCGHGDKYDKKEKSHLLLSVVTTEFQKTVLQICIERNDAWSTIVKGRIEYVNDLPAEGAVYHHLCSSNFRTGRQLPQQFITKAATAPKQKKSGRPSQAERDAAFDKVAEWLESNDDEQTTIHDLTSKMQDFLADTNYDAYGFTYMKQKLVNHFGNRIIMTEINGMRNVVTFRHTAYSILQDFYNQPKNDNLANGKMRIIETAAKLIKSEVKSVVQLNKGYPTSAEMSSTNSALSFVPESLKQLLTKHAVGKNVDTKIASLGKAIMQCTRPRALIAPLQIGLGVQMHRHFGSKFLIDSLHQNGFCSSYQEVQRFERCAAVSHGTELPNINSGQFLQYVADNVDHNTRTIDGLNTFHGMGMIVIVTPRRG